MVDTTHLMARALVAVKADAFEAAEILAIAYYRPEDKGAFSRRNALREARARLEKCLSVIDEALAEIGILDSDLSARDRGEVAS